MTAPLRQQRRNIGLGENQADLAQVLSLLLDMQPDLRCSGTAATCAGVLQLAQAVAMDGWLLDLTLDDGSSLPIITALRAANSRAAIVVMTGLGSAAIDAGCLSAGADAVIPKDGQVLRLLVALRQHLRPPDPRATQA